MSVNPDGGDVTDYSDFEYQTATQSVILQEAADSTGGGNIRARVVSEIDPLAGVGGLDNNEVAELVYLETQAQLEFQDDSNDQDVASTGYAKGVVGANLSPSTDSFPGQRSTNSDSTIVSADNIGEPQVTGIVRGGSEDRWFQPFQAIASTPFDDQTNGPGGSGSAESHHSEKMFRSVVGRGPVLDSSDELSIATEASVDDTVINAEARVTLQMVWDVAETSDAGRAFSVPMDD